MLSSVGHLLPAAVKKGVPSARGGAGEGQLNKTTTTKHGAFGLSSKSTFLLSSTFTAREDKSKSPSVRLLNEYK